MGWNHSQQVTLALVPKFSSVLSLLGSFWIVTEVLTGTHGAAVPNRTHPYHRLLLAMSLYDIAESFWNFLSTWPIPAGTEGVVWAVGTTQTCTAQGFFLMLGIAVPIYNAFLALYYMLVVNFRVTDTTLKRRVEPAMHLIALGWGLGTSLAASSMGLMNNANLWCWIAPLPGDCLDSWRHENDGNCTRGDNAWIYRWGFYFAPLWFCIVFAGVCTFMVCSKVKRLDNRTLIYRQPERSSSFIVRSGSVTMADGSGAASSHTENDCGLDGVPPARSNNNNNNGILQREASSSIMPVEPDLSHLNLVARWWKRRQLFANDNPRTVEVQQQASWYLLAFVLTHLWSTSNRIKQQMNDGSTVFGLIVVHSFFDPLQGFLNFLVYQRPRYIRIRKENPDISWWEAATKLLVFSCKLRKFEARQRARRQSDTRSNGNVELQPIEEEESELAVCPFRVEDLSSSLKEEDQDNDASKAATPNVKSNNDVETETDGEVEEICRHARNIYQRATD